MPKKTKKAPYSQEKIAAENVPSSPVTIDSKSSSLLISITAKPGSKTTEVTGIDAESVSVSLNAPPVDGEANAELCKFIAKILAVRKTDVSLVKGHKSRQKVVSVQTDVSPADALSKLENV